jgi:D-Tyr-tRNAtyr deacylase
MLDDYLVASSNQGLLAFVGIEDGDTEEDVDSMVQRILQTVLWPEENEPQVSSMCSDSEHDK